MSADLLTAGDAHRAVREAAEPLTSGRSLSLHLPRVPDASLGEPGAARPATEVQPVEVWR